MIHLQTQLTGKLDTTHGDDIELENETILTDSQDSNFMGDEGCVDDPEITNFDIAIEYQDDHVRLSEHVSSFANDLS